MPIQDMYSVMPDEFLEFGDAIVHNLSWQQARHINTPIRGVYVANPGYVLGAAGMPRGAVISEAGVERELHQAGDAIERRRESREFIKTEARKVQNLDV